MDSIFDAFTDAYTAGSGYALSETFLPFSPASDPERLPRFWKSTNSAQVRREIESRLTRGNQYTDDETKAWIEVYIRFWTTVGEILKVEQLVRGTTQASWQKVYDTWKEFTTFLIQGYSKGHFGAWTLPCLYVAGKYLRIFAIKADEEITAFGGTLTNLDDSNPEAGQNGKLEDVGRMLQRMFQLCLSDRSPIEESRKWGLYVIINLQFKTYFKLNSVDLCNSTIRAIAAIQHDMPPLESFPKAHQVTFKYYRGRILFLEEDYVQAEKFLTEAWTLCHKDATRNKELILTYLIPCHLLTAQTLPTLSLLGPYPRLQKLFFPLSKCIKSGDLNGFDLALQAGEEEFVKRRIYLTLERGRDIALRNLLRKVFIAGGYEEVKPGDEGKPLVRRTRIPVSEFGAAISVGSKEIMDGDEVECLLANMIYKGFVKGYISRERSVVVLSKGGAFPGTNV